jgi:integrase
VLLGLLACTGLRISEALGLHVADVNLVRGVLCVRESKYHKLRWVPLHATTVRRLKSYLRQRRRWPSRDPHLFVAKHGDRLLYATVHRVFRQLRRGLAEPAKPRLHDLRHRFAVRVLMRWQAQKQGVAHRLPILACYLGHNQVAHTYWYLQAFPELLAQAARAFRPIGK